MKNINKKFCLVIAACLCIVGFANADEDKEEKPSSVICDLYPAYCGATTQGGNGGGYEPPPKK
jgi:hypothetical protein